MSVRYKNARRFFTLLCFIALSGNCAPGLVKPPPGTIQITPTSISPLSETSVRLNWQAPTGRNISYYSVSISNDINVAPHQDLANIRFDPSATSATATGLPAGSFGQIVVVGVTEHDADRVSANGAAFWTPYGAVNETSVNSFTPLSGYNGSQYAEGLFISPTFSLITGAYYDPILSHVYNKVPTNADAPLLNLFNRAIATSADGYVPGFQMDVSQVWSDGVSKVAVRSGNRVLVWNKLPLSGDLAIPDIILGEPNRSSTAANAGTGAVNRVGFGSSAGGVCFNGNTLYAGDLQNARVLGWNGWPTQTGQPADFVLGQPDFISSATNNGGASKSSIAVAFNTGALSCDFGRLIVTDAGNHRVLIWNSAPTNGGIAADIVLGQALATNVAANGAGGAAVGGLNFPTAVLQMINGSNTALLAADYQNNRIVQWNSIPTAAAQDGQAFDQVYGQPNSASVAVNAGGLRSISTLNLPSAISAEPGTTHFWVSDFGNKRAMVFNLNTTASASSVYGQRDGATSESFFGSVSPTRLPWEIGLLTFTNLDPSTGVFSIGANTNNNYSCGGHLWNAAPTNGNTPADFVQGQAGLSYCVDGLSTTATSIIGPFSTAKVGPRTYWSDNNRILSKVGTFNGNNQIPDVVLGSQNFSGANVAPVTFDVNINPSQLLSDGTRLLAIDGPRIVGWDVAPTVSNPTIDFAIGQPDRTTRAPGLSATLLSATVKQMILANGKLIVADTGNNRILIWNQIPSASGVPADVVLGQNGFGLSTTGTSLNQLNAPSGVAVNNGKLLVADNGNRRILVWKTIPTASSIAANSAWDPHDYSFSLPSWISPSMFTPNHIFAYAQRIYLELGDRILVIPDIF